MHFRSQSSRNIRRYRRDVDRFVAVFGLDPNLEEVKDLKEQAWRAFAFGGMGFKNFRRLSPDYGTHFDSAEQALIVEITRPQSLLSPWTIARWHINNIDDLVCEIVANATDTSLLDADGRPLVKFLDAAIDPHLQEGAGYGYRQSAKIIHEFCDIQVSWQWHMERGRTQLMRVERTQASSWKFSYETALFANFGSP